MRPLRYQFPAARVVLADAVAALASPPTRTPRTYGVVPASWNSTDSEVGVVPQFHLEIWGSQASDLTASSLLGAVQHPFAPADTTVTLDNTTEKLAHTAHGFVDGDGPFMLTVTAGALPPELTTVAKYYLVKVDADHVQLAASLQDALNGTAIPFSTNGTGTIKLVKIAPTGSDTAGFDGGTQRIYWHSLGALDATVSVGTQLGRTVLFDHRSSVVAYAIAGAISASGVSAAIIPVQDIA